MHLIFFVMSFLDVSYKTATVQHRIDIFWEWKLPIRFSLRRRAYNKTLLYLSFLIKSFLIKSFLIKYSTLVYPERSCFCHSDHGSITTFCRFRYLRIERMLKIIGNISCSCFANRQNYYLEHRNLTITVQKLKKVSM